MRQAIVAVAVILAATGLNGCHIDTDRHGDSEKVRIATPFGGLQVRTNDADVLAGIGLPAYPGATLVKKEHGKGDNSSADVNLSFGTFQLKVKTLSYRTSDTPEQVLEFYRKALGRFGDVIQCDHHGRPVGTSTHTQEGLTCDDESHGHLHVSSDLPVDNGHETKFQLKAGSKKHQHIVAMNADDPGTKFALVSLDLPGEFPFGSGDSSDGDKKQ